MRQRKDHEEILTATRRGIQLNRIQSSWKDISLEFTLPPEKFYERGDYLLENFARLNGWFSKEKQSIWETGETKTELSEIVHNF